MRGDWVEQTLLVDRRRAWSVLAVCVGHVVLGEYIFNALGLLQGGGSGRHVSVNLNACEVAKGP